MGRTLLKGVAVKYDPLLVFVPRVSAEQEGWYTCVLGNNEGRNEISTFLEVRGGDDFRGVHDSQS